MFVFDKNVYDLLLFTDKYMILQRKGKKFMNLLNTCSIDEIYNSLDDILNIPRGSVKDFISWAICNVF